MKIYHYQNSATKTLLAFASIGLPVGVWILVSGLRSEGFGRGALIGVQGTILSILVTAFYALSYKNAHMVIDGDRVERFDRLGKKTFSARLDEVRAFHRIGARQGVNVYQVEAGLHEAKFDSNMSDYEDFIQRVLPAGGQVLEN